MTYRDRILRITEVCEMTSLGKSLIWEMVRDGDFPAPRQLSARRKGWLESEVVEWLHATPQSDEAA